MARQRGSSTVAIVAILCLAAGCSRSHVPNLEPYSTRQPYEEIFGAPIVVVGVLVADTPVPRRASAPAGLYRIDLRVENTLRGDLASGTVPVYYFARADPKPSRQWKAGDRKILWLRTDSGILRTACDGPDPCTMPVGSGAHPQYRPVPQRALGYALADILLTRGEGANDAEFAKGVEWAAPGTIPEAYLFARLRHLAATETSLVRDAACQQLAYYQQSCVPPAKGTTGR